ncbi:VIT and vWA domain-containing protein [Aspergillus puulaauensis]|uniref:Uncharacterized protein n=1 Tax=Aspergillus puulaauensis TaxID=1220207 RepID=A0A7R7XU71_9EURO|nr:uncharacterized protein APUU_60859A [Aspergillus puulaauensis]BCS27811.1 hypothetical protein APUU_60859A [Aspergillus puulaauensis]
MNIRPCITFQAVEPPSPHLDERSWVWVPRPETEEGREPNRESSPSEPEAPQRRQAQLLPSSVDISINVTQGMAKATLTQIFCNDAPDNIDKAIYQFPMPYESSVVDFKCQIGETKTLQGLVRPKAEAREEFDQALSSGRSAGLVEQDRLDVFRTEIGNIPANATVQVKLEFIFFLKYTLADDVTTTLLTIPTYIAPRYGHPSFELVSKTGPQDNTRFSLGVNILNATEIRKIHSDTHEVIVEMEGSQRSQHWADSASPGTTSASVKLKDATCLDKDFILSISAHPGVDDEQPQATLEISPSGSSAMMLEIPPGFILRDQPPIKENSREIIFLADRSGSMYDRKIAGLKSSLEFFLHGLPETLFNLYCFGSNYTSLWRKSKKYSDDTLTKALKYVSSFQGDMGGTELLPALKAVVYARDKTTPNMDVIVLTDGEVWELEETVDFVREARAESGGALRFFTMGIGDGVSHELVEGIARAGGGYAEIIPLVDGGSWDERMVAVLKAAMSGHVAGVDIEVEGVTMESRDLDGTGTTAAVQMSPGDLSSMSPFIRNRIYILAENENNPINAQSMVKIKRKSTNGQETATEIPLHVLQKPDSTLHQFAAGALLRDLGSGQSWIQRGKRIPGYLNDEKELTREEGERLGCKYSLLSQWTSFVAVETDTEDTDGEPSERPEYATEIANLEPQLDSAATDIHALRNMHYQLQGAIDTVDDGMDTSMYDLDNANTQLGVGVSLASIRWRFSRLLFPMFFWRVAKHGWMSLSNRYLMGLKTESQSQTDLEESFIRRVLKIQKSAGVFDVPQKDALRCLGSDVHGIAEALHVKGVQWNVAVTVAIVAWLEVKFPEDRSLWVRMVEKAREYIQPHLGMELGECEGSLLDVAEKMARDAKDPSKESHGINKGQ